MYRQQKALNFKSRKLLASALIQPYFDYAAPAWYFGIPKSMKQRLQTAQNKISRFILNLGPRSHIGQNELNTIGLLNTHSRVKYLTLNHMYAIFHDTAPAYLRELFVKTQSNHHYSTRGAEHNFSIPHISGLEIANFSYQGPKAWNSISTNLKHLQSKDGFKKGVKQFLKDQSLLSEQTDFI